MSTDNADTANVESSRIEAEQGEDQRVDSRAILVIFTVTVLMAMHFVSGFTFS